MLSHMVQRQHVGHKFYYVAYDLALSFLCIKHYVEYTLIRYKNPHNVLISFIACESNKCTNECELSFTYNSFITSCYISSSTFT